MNEDELRGKVEQLLLAEKIKQLREKGYEQEMRSFVLDAKQKQMEYEYRYNHYHDPHNGRFASAGAAGSGANYGQGLYYSMGKGKGEIVGAYSEYKPLKSILTNSIKTGKIIDEPKSNVSDCKNFDDLENTLKNKYNIILDRKVTQCDFEAVKQSMIGVTSLIDEYPEVADSIDRITTTRRNTIMSYNATEKSICIRPSWFKDREKLENQLNSDSEIGWTYKNSTIVSIGRHEAAHALERTMIDMMPNNPYDSNPTKSKLLGFKGHRISRPVVDNAIKNVQQTPYGKGKTEKEIREAASKYGATGHGEQWAEAFADVYTNGSKANPLSIEIVNLGRKNYEDIKTLKKTRK